jgi:co-chaperonin GroES (HSP10)
MSESAFVLPENVTLPEALQPVDEVEEGLSDEQRARRVPKPTGYRLLCVVPDVKDTFEGTSLIKASSIMKGEEHGTTVLFVLDVGPDAYKDEAKFPSGPWCKAGDFVLVRTYTGTRFKIYGKEFRLLNDDQIDAVVDDPRGISRVAV